MKTDFPLHKSKPYVKSVVRMPAFLATALINGDTSGLEPRDMPMLERALEFCKGAHIADCSEPYFDHAFIFRGEWFNGDVADYTLLYTRKFI